MGSSRPNFAATPHFPDLSTPLESLFFLTMSLDPELMQWLEGNLGKIECQVRTVHTISRTQAQTPTITCLHMRKIEPHFMCGFGHGKLCH